MVFSSSPVYSLNDSGRNLGRLPLQILVLGIGHTIDPFDFAFTLNAGDGLPSVLAIVPCPCSERVFCLYAARSRGNVEVEVLLLAIDLTKDAFE